MDVTDTIGFERYPNGRRITRYDVENYGLTLNANGHDLDDMIHAIGHAANPTHAYELLFEYEKSHSLPE